MQEWIIAFILSAVAFLVIRQYRYSNANAHTEWSVTSQVAIFSALFIVSLGLAHFFMGNTVSLNTGVLSGGDLETDMLTRINQDVHVGLPPF